MLEGIASEKTSCCSTESFFRTCRTCVSMNRSGVMMK